MWAFIDSMTRGPRRAGPRPFAQTWPMIVGAGMGIAAWEFSKRQNFSWLRRTADRVADNVASTVSDKRRQMTDAAD